MPRLPSLPLESWSETKQALHLYLQVIGNCLGSSNYDIAVELAELPQSIRGYGHVKEAAVGQYRARSGILLETLRTGEKQQAIAAE